MIHISEGNYRNYVMDNLTCEIMENKPLGSWSSFYEFYEWYKLFSSKKLVSI